MDRKSVLILAVSFVLILSWQKMMDHFYPRKPIPASTNMVNSATNELASSTNEPVLRAPSTNQQIPLIEAGAPEEFLYVTNQDAIYTFTSHGGGLKLIELRNYKETIKCGSEVPGERRPATLNTKAPTPVLALTGGESLQSDGVFQLTRTDKGVRAEKRLASGLVVVKDFEPGTNYLFKARIRLENTSGAPLKLPPQEISVGTATPMGPYDNGMEVGFFWYNGTDDEHVAEGYFANRTLGCLPLGTPFTNYHASSSNVVWAAVHNQFFALAVIPNQPASEIISKRISLPLFDPGLVKKDSSATKDPVGYETALVYPGTVMAQDGVIEREFTIYAGPREYNTLAKLGAELKNDLDDIMGFHTRFGGRMMGFFAKILLLSMNGLHSTGLSYGLSIIGITIIIKLLFWPLTAASTRSMKRMQLLQPEMAKIKEKYKDDPKKAQMKTMEFMREKKINPIGGCLPMLVQIPIFMGFYSMLQSAIELRGVSFLWACDLSQADTVAHIAGFPLNILPLLMGVTMLWQARLTPPSPGMEPMQQKMMQYMPLLFLFMLYNMSSGLTLYWTVQNLLTIAQTKLTKTKDPVADVVKTPTGPPTKKKKI